MEGKKSLFVIIAPREKPVSDEKIREDYDRRHSDAAPMEEKPETETAELTLEEKETMISDLNAQLEYREHNPYSKLIDGEDGSKYLVLDIESLIKNVIEPYTGDAYTIFRDGDNSRCQFVFSLGDDTEKVLHRLHQNGVGSAFGSIHIIPLSISVSSSSSKLQREDSDSQDSSTANFGKTIKSRLIVQQVVEQAKAQAAFSFDFVLLTIVASILAGIGLATDNTVIIVASMLVSPIMGPILAVCFGSVINDWKMAKDAFYTECIALCFCMVSGFLVGLAFSPFGEGLDWPDDEMESRGSWVGLLIGIAIAFPSGIGVALSVLGNNTNSLVGVAISASLLPPAVNAGLLWSYAFYGAIADSDINQLYFIELGGVSILLTILNIFFVYAGAILMFKIKEVAPIPGKSDLWKYYIPEVRRQKTIKGEEAAALKSLLQDVGVIKRDSYHASPSHPMHAVNPRGYNYAMTVDDFLGAQDLAKQFKSNSLSKLSGKKVRIAEPGGNVGNPPSVEMTSSPLMSLFTDPELGKH